MDKLKEIRDDNIRDGDGIDNSENRRSIKRKPKKIRKFFKGLFERFSNDVKYDDVKFKYDQFVKYVKIVSNNEIELIHGGDNSKLKSHLKMLWKTLSEEYKTVEEEAAQIEKMIEEQK